MADVTVIEAQVLPVTDTNYDNGILGETITAGQAVYLDSTTGKYLKADANASAIAAKANGIAMTGGVLDQPVRVAIGGHIDPGFLVAAGAIYIVSATPGGIAPVADLASLMFTHILALGITASSMKIVNATAGVAVP